MAVDSPTIDYLDKLRKDLLEQFRGKPNIEVFQAAIARQLEEVYEVLYQLDTLRWLQNAEGVQLDGIGDIVCLSRSEALTISQLADMNVPMDDELYRLYLTWKIALNTSNCTHTDRHRSLKLFWDKTPIYYSEDPEYPATMFLTVSHLFMDAGPAVYKISSKIKAAGVGIHYIFTGDEQVGTDYSAGYIVETITEYIYEDAGMITDKVDYEAGAIYEAVREVFTENG